MPFMLQSCGHAMRFTLPDGICGRCTMVIDGESRSHEDVESDFRVNAENVAPPTNGQQQQDNNVKNPFLEQVEKLVAIMVNSEGPELNDAMTHVARSMSTFTAGERADFVYELVIKYCEARREDQPKIDFLLKELGKKSVLARPHFLQSAKRLVAETEALVVDWPNIYDCTVQLIATNLSLLKNPTENLEALGKALNGAATIEQAVKYLLPLRRHFPAVHIPGAKDGRNLHPAGGDGTGGPDQPRSAVDFFLPPETAAKDKFIRPVGLRSPSPAKPSRISYSRAVMLEIERHFRDFPLPDGLLERVKMMKSDTGFGGAGYVGHTQLDQQQQQRQDGGGPGIKRQRFVSESGSSAEQQHYGGTSIKRMLESNSPPLVLSRHGGGADWKHSGQRDSYNPSPSSPGASFSGGGGFERPRFVSESVDKGQPNSPFSYSAASPKKPLHEEHPHQPHEGAAGVGQSRHDSFGSQSSAVAAAVAPVQSPIKSLEQQPSRHTATGASGKAPSLSGAAGNSRPASGKTKKFLTALNVERITEPDTNQLSPTTLSPNVKTWSRGSGSLTTGSSVKPGGSGTSPLKSASPALVVPPRPFGLNNQQHNSPRGPVMMTGGDHFNSRPFRMSPGGGGGDAGSPAAASDHHHHPHHHQHQPDQNWRRGLSQA